MRLTELDGLRAMSILLVLAAHFFPLGPKLLQLNFAAGAMGMSLFFALSGFLIASRLLASPAIIDFVARRAARILPLVYLYLLLLLIFFNEDVSEILWTAAFAANYKTQYLNGLNGHLWSLCVEVQFYIAIALTVLVFGSKGVWLVWPLCLVVTLLRIDASAVIDIRTHLRVDEILAGAGVASIFHKVGKSWLTLPIAALPLASLFWLLCCLSQMGPLQYARPYSSALVLAAAIWTTPEDYIKAVLISRPARYIAEISYALYIFHPASAFGWMNEGSVEVRYLLKRPLSLLATFSLAHLSTFYWETMWINWAKAWLTYRKRAH